ncbi:hypothetical protein D3C85_1644660 [compost metagenome]
MAPPNVKSVTVSKSRSGSLSLVSTLPIAGVSSVTGMTPSLAASGASLTGLTLPKLSSAVSVRLPSLSV